MAGKRKIKTQGGSPAIEEERREMMTHPCWNGKRLKHMFDGRVMDCGVLVAQCKCGMLNFISE